MTIEFVHKHISKKLIITGNAQHKEVWEYPLEALREVIINMIVHRDYQSNADSTIKVFSNRIELYNPGGLPKGISIKDIITGKVSSIPRNKQIALVFKESGIIEKYGSGIKRVLETMKVAGAPRPVFESIANTFKVTLYPIREEPREVTGGVNGGVNEILDFVRNNPGTNTTRIHKEFDIPRRTIERRLKKLKEQRKIEFRGAPKTGGYYVIEKT